ncbi:MAG TPA: TetR/AcrR family transcriptional regulator [Candidatus Angelobacter sp.]|nr:TetR/AcrR family transcriptional regulator [Candidatus Angelobacter sp.]
MTQKSVETNVKDEELIRIRRDQLVKAAVKLFTEKGFHRTTTREIAKASGFSIGTLYEYIRSKEDALFLVCDDIYNKVSEKLKLSMAVKGSGLTSLENAIKGCIHVMDDMQDEVLVMYQEAKSLSKESLSYVLNKEKDMAYYFKEVLDHCVQNGALTMTEKEKTFFAHQILVQCQMWAFRRWSLRKDFTIEEYKDLQVNAIINGLSAYKMKFKKEDKKGGEVQGADVSST